MDLLDLRKQIDEIDEQLIPLLLQRMDIAVMQKRLEFANKKKKSSFYKKTGTSPKYNEKDF